MLKLINLIATVVVVLVLIKVCSSIQQTDALNLEWLKYSMFLIPIFSFVLCVHTFKALSVYREFKKTSITVLAEIVDFQETSGASDKVELYAPKYQYLYKGNTYQNLSTVSTGNKPELHSKVRIEVDPNDPNTFAETGFFHKFSLYASPIMSLAGLCLGVVLSTYLVIELWFSR